MTMVMFLTYLMLPIYPTQILCVLSGARTWQTYQKNLIWVINPSGFSEDNIVYPSWSNISH